MQRAFFIIRTFIDLHTGVKVAVIVAISRQSPFGAKNDEIHLTECSKGLKWTPSQKQISGGMFKSRIPAIEMGFPSGGDTECSSLPVVLCREGRVTAQGAVICFVMSM
jgi:hypothetical protein